MLIFKALHIISMFTTVTIFVGQGLFLASAIQRRDPRRLAAVYLLAGRRRLTVAGIAFLLLGVAFGLTTAFTGGLDLTSRWLIVAYVLVAFIFVFNNSPMARRLLELGNDAVEAEAGHGSSEAIAERMARTPALAWVVVNIFTYVAVIVDMVFKPF